MASAWMTIAQCPQTLRVSVISAAFSSTASVVPLPPVTGGADSRSGVTRRARKESGVADTCCLARTSAAGRCCAVVPSCPSHPDEGEWHVCTVYTTCSQAKHSRRTCWKTSRSTRSDSFIHAESSFLSSRKDRLEPNTSACGGVFSRID